MRICGYWLSIVLSIFFFFFSACLTYAHFSVTDGDMTVTLHVDPNDDPTPGKQAHLYFFFEDTTKRFKLINCTCTISITELGKQTDTQPLVKIGSSKLSIWGAIYISCEECLSYCTYRKYKKNKRIPAVY